MVLNNSINILKKVNFKIIGRPLKIDDNHSDITCLNYDPEGKNIAVGTYDGSIKIFSSYTGK